MLSAASMLRRRVLTIPVLFLWGCGGTTSLEIDLFDAAEGSEWFAVWIEGAGLEEGEIVDTAAGPSEQARAAWSKVLGSGDSLRVETASYEVPLEDWKLEPGPLVKQDLGAGLPPPWRGKARTLGADEDSGWLESDELPARLAEIHNARLPSRCPSFEGWDVRPAPPSSLVGTGDFVAEDERFGWATSDYDLYRVDGLEGTWTKTATLCAATIDVEGTLTATVPECVPALALDLDRKRQRLWMASYVLGVSYIDLAVDPHRVIRVLPRSDLEEDHKELFNVDHRPRRMKVLEETGEVLLMTSSSYVLRYREHRWEVLQDGDPSGRGTFSGTLIRLSEAEAVFSRYPPMGIQFYSVTGGLGRVELDDRSIIGLALSDRLGLLAGGAAPPSLLSRDEFGNWQTVEESLGVPLEHVVDVPDGILIRTQTGSGEPRLLKKLSGRPACGVEDEDLAAVERFRFGDTEGPIAAIWALGPNLVVHVVRGFERRQLLIRPP